MQSEVASHPVAEVKDQKGQNEEKRNYCLLATHLSGFCIASSCISSNWAGTHGVRGHTVGTRLGLNAWETCRRLAIYIGAAKSEKHCTHGPCTNKEFTFKPHGLCRARKAVNTGRIARRGPAAAVSKTGREHHHCAPGGKIPLLSFHHTHLTNHSSFSPKPTFLKV